MLKAYKYQIFPTEDQRVLIEKHFGCCRWIYNYALAKKIKAYQDEGKMLMRYDLQAELPILKKQDETSWLSEVQAQSLQVSIKNLDTAFKNFFREKKGYPRFRSKHGKQSYQYPQNVRVDFDRGVVVLPKLKGVRVCFSRKFDGKIKTVTVSRSATRKYYVSILVDDGRPLPEKKPASIARAVGIDLGLKDLATLSTGEKIDNPRFLKKHLGRLARLQRKASRKIKGSNNRKKANYRVAKLHERISNLRTNHLHQLSARLIKESQFDTFCVEDLNVAGMVQNRKLARSISDVSWSEFIRQLTYKAEWYGKNVIAIGRFEPSSKTCSCGHINSDLTLKERTWTCVVCNVTHDRDILAARNIRQFAFNNLIGEGAPRINACGDAALAASAKQE